MLMINKQTIYDKNNFTWDLVKFFELEDNNDFFKVYDQLVELYIDGYKNLEDYHYKDLKDIKDYIKWLFYHSKENRLIIIAKVEKEIVGFIAGNISYYDKKIEKTVMNIHELVVKPNYRSKGIGSYLIYEFIKRAKNKNKQRNKKIDHVILWVGENNQKAKKLYENIGFYTIDKVNKWIKMIMKL